MKYVILRDDDTSAVTPPACLERLYRPFLDRGFPVTLATIPNVNLQAKWADGQEEGFLLAKGAGDTGHLSIAQNERLLEYLRENAGFRLAHHGYEHTYLEFNQPAPSVLGRKLDEGRVCFREAGIEPPGTFVAPYDQLSRSGYEEVAKRFRVLSTGWYEWRSIPPAWRLQYLLKKAFRRPHWQAGGLVLLTHPGCLLSHQRPVETILPAVQHAVRQNSLTVLVTHWWEYFHRGQANDRFIRVLHETARWLDAQPDLRIVSFQEMETLQGAPLRNLLGHPGSPASAPAGPSEVQPQPLYP